VDKSAHGRKAGDFPLCRRLFVSSIDKAAYIWSYQ
jgi:hypothetical protein